MSKKVDTSDWTYEEFLGFTLLYAANADVAVNNKEKHLIENKVGSAQYANALTWFEQCNDYQRLQAILSLKSKYFSSPEEKQSVIRNIKEVFLADGKFDQVEKSLLLFLQRFL